MVDTMGPVMDMVDILPLDIPLVLDPLLIVQLLDIQDDDTFTQTLSAGLGLTEYRDSARDAILLDFYCYLLEFAKENHFEAEKTCLLVSLLAYLHTHAMEHKLDASSSFALYKQLILQHSSIQSSNQHPVQQIHPSLHQVEVSSASPSLSFQLPISKLDPRPATPPIITPPHTISQSQSHHPSQTKLMQPTTTHNLRHAGFTCSDVAALTSFLTSSYFMHYSLYSLVFQAPQDIHEEHQFIWVESPVTPPPLSKAYTEQEWAQLQVQEHQHRIASELAFLKHSMQDSEPTDKLDESGIPVEDKDSPGLVINGVTGEDKSSHAHPLHAHSLLTSAHPFMFNSLLHSPAYHPHHSISASTSQSETQKIFDSVNQAATAQIGQLREALQKQFEEQEKQILELIARVDNELTAESTKPAPAPAPAPAAERKRTPVKSAQQSLPSVASRPSTTSNLTPKGHLVSSSDSHTTHDSAT